MPAVDCGQQRFQVDPQRTTDEGPELGEPKLEELDRSDRSGALQLEESGGNLNQALKQDPAVGELVDPALLPRFVGFVELPPVEKVDPLGQARVKSGAHHGADAITGSREAASPFPSPARISPACANSCSLLNPGLGPGYPRHRQRSPAPGCA